MPKYEVKYNVVDAVIQPDANGSLKRVVRGAEGKALNIEADDNSALHSSVCALEGKDNPEDVVFTSVSSQ